MITSLIVWGAIPFVAITVYAGLTQVPGELLEAAQIDGSGAFRRFRDVTFPILKPIFVILASLSIIWDFQVFTQPFLLRLQRPDPDYWLMSIYAYEKSFGISQYGLGSAIALVMLLLMLGVTFFYIRQMVRIGEVTVTAAVVKRRGVAAGRSGALLRRSALNLAGARRVRGHGLPGLLDGRDRVQARRRDHELHAEVASAPPDARALHRRDPRARSSGTTSATA